MTFDEWVESKGATEAMKTYGFEELMRVCWNAALSQLSDLPDEWRKWRNNPDHPLHDPSEFTKADTKDECATELQDRIERLKK